MRLLADENFSAKIVSWLRSVGHDVASVAKATPDSAVVAQALRKSWVILTHDADFAEEEVYKASAGVMLIRINPLHADRIKSAILRTLAQIPESRWKGKLVFVFEEASMESKAGKFFPWP